MAWTENGFQVDDFDTLMQTYYSAFIAQPQYSDVSYDRFVASKEYEQFYASAQIDQSIQLAMSESMTQIQTFINSIGFLIATPKTTPNAIVSEIKNSLGFDASIKPVTATDAGNLYLAIDYTPDDTANANIGEILKNSVAGGVFTHGDISQDVALANGDPWTFSWQQMALGNIAFRTSVVVSRNATLAVDSEGEIAQMFNDNYQQIYRAGADIEPQKYLEIERDLPYAAKILTQYSLDGGQTWLSDVLQTDFNIKYAYQMVGSDVTISYEADIIPDLIVSASADNTTITEGETVTLMVSSIGGVKPYHYQWQSSADGSTYADIADKTSSVLTTSPTAAQTGIYYHCVVKDSQEAPISKITNAVKVTVTASGA